MRDFYQFLENVMDSSASEDGIPHILGGISPGAWRGHGWRDLTQRKIAADYLDDLGRREEANLLRQTDKHIYKDRNHQIYDAGELSKNLHQAVKSAKGSRTPQRFFGGHLNSSDLEYLRAELFIGMDEEGRSLDDNYTIADIDPATVAAMVTDWRRFLEENHELIGDNENEAAHDFALSRNSHGAGYFDDNGDLYNGNGPILQKQAQRHGEYSLYVGDDGKLHGMYGVKPNK